MVSSVSFRVAKRDDVPVIVRMLADDALGAQRERLEDPLPASYYMAFEHIESDPNNELVIAENERKDVIGVLQLTFIPSLTYQGSWRALVEGVRVSATVRGQGVGRLLLEHAIARARTRGCHMIQLTTDKRRSEAKHFYESLGFQASHEGMKLSLAPTPAFE